jgi:hypothetical protein
LLRFLKYLLRYYLVLQGPSENRSNSKGLIWFSIGPSVGKNLLSEPYRPGGVRIFSLTHKNLFASSWRRGKQNISHIQEAKNTRVTSCSFVPVVSMQPRKSSELLNTCRHRERDQRLHDDPGPWPQPRNRPRRPRRRWGWSAIDLVLTSPAQDRRLLLDGILSKPSIQKNYSDSLCSYLKRTTGRNTNGPSYLLRDRSGDIWGSETWTMCVFVLWAIFWENVLVQNLVVQNYCGQNCTSIVQKR